MISQDSIAASPLRIPFDNTYSRLPERFYGRRNPTQVVAPKLIKLNRELARELGVGLDGVSDAETAQIFSGNKIAEGSQPLAMAYAGHQFGHFVPTLGDGRANLLGEVVALDGERYDIQLKGAGQTPFSRRGDGRAALGPVLREYVVSEAMTALGVPSTRALAAVTTGERVFRESALPGAVLTRVAKSHLRVGSFQYFAARNDVEGLKLLAEFAIARHYPETAKAEKKYRAFFEGVVVRQARLIAQWMLLGFIHGVMNTDNMSISGETIDYGPCAFLEAFDPQKVYSSIDQQGRYGYSNQPHAAHWNLTRLAEALLPLLMEEEGSEEAAVASAQEALGLFAPEFDASHLAGLRRKLGLFEEHEEDAALAGELLQAMADYQADFTLTFRRLCDAAADEGADEVVRGLFYSPTAYDSWAVKWRERLGRESVGAAERAAAMRVVNPVYIPRNHLVEEMIAAAVEREDFSLFERLLEVVTRPFEEVEGGERYAVPARVEELVRATFCGT